MTTVREVLAAVETIAPFRLAFASDRVGLQVGDEDKLVRRGLITLDWSIAAAERARAESCDIILSHHPLIWEPLARVVASQSPGQVLLKLAESGIALAAIHTNWDCAPGGLNDALAERLDLREVSAFGLASARDMILVVVYAPEDAVAGLIDALAEEGAGTIGLYDRCAFVNSGEGTFRPVAGAKPAVGSIGKIEVTPERRIEMVAPAGQRRSLELAIRRSHPYEEPAYELVPYSASGWPIGRIGQLSEPMPLREFVAHVDHRLETSSCAWGDPSRYIRRVAVVGGAADEEWKAAMAENADVLVTGEVRQHVAVEATDAGFAMVAAGHYATEQPGMDRLAARLRVALPDVDWVVGHQVPGHGGRPWSRSLLER